MCKNYLKIVNGVVTEAAGALKEGSYMVCPDCKVVSKKDGCYKKLYDLTEPKPVNFEEEEKNND